MASALCALACERRLEARFFTASSLVMRLRRARDDGRLDREAALIGKARLLVIDELGFLPLDADGARLLFQVFADAYERQSVVITTNLEFSRWGSVFGDDYPTPDGSNIRDYIDVVDLAKAHVTAIARMIEGKNREKYEIFNIGTGRGVSVLELVRKFEEVNNLKLNYKIVGRRAGDIVAIWADPSYANDELGWKAERSLDQTLAAAWKWEKHIRGIE